MHTLTFIVPLRAPETAGNWQKVSALANRTLGSIRNQSSDSWKCMLVCHEPPVGFRPHRNIEILQVGMPVPRSHAEAMSDKRMKKKAGLSLLRRDPSRYTMLLDADDLVCHNLVAFLSDKEVRSGWEVAREYVHFENWPFLIRRNTADRGWCCYAIFRVAPQALPKTVEDNGRTPIMLPHNEWRQYFARRGHPLQALPFYAVTICRGTGENEVNSAPPPIRSVGGVVGRILSSRPVSATISRRFNLYPLPPRFRNIR